jgi:hypothetical protein
MPVQKRVFLNLWVWYSLDVFMLTHHAMPEVVGSTMPKTRPGMFERFRPWLVIGGVTALFALAFLLLTSLRSSEAAVRITWAPPSIDQDIPAGQSITIPISFTTSQTLTDVVLRVVPGLAPFVEVEPPSFSHIATGENAQVSLVISVPQAAELKTHSGTVQLRQGLNGPTLARPLPVTINVIGWPLYVDPLTGVSLSYPPNLRPTPSSDHSQVGFYDDKSFEGALMMPLSLFMSSNCRPALRYLSG